MKKIWILCLSLAVLVGLAMPVLAAWQPAEMAWKSPDFIYNPALLVYSNISSRGQPIANLLYIDASTKGEGVCTATYNHSQFLINNLSESGSINDFENCYACAQIDTVPYNCQLSSTPAQSKQTAFGQNNYCAQNNSAQIISQQNILSKTDFAKQNSFENNSAANYFSAKRFSKAPQIYSAKFSAKTI